MYPLQVYYRHIEDVHVEVPAQMVVHVEVPAQMVVHAEVPAQMVMSLSAEAMVSSTIPALSHIFAKPED